MEGKEHEKRKEELDGEASGWIYGGECLRVSVLCNRSRVALAGSGGSGSLTRRGSGLTDLFLSRRSFPISLFLLCPTLTYAF